MGEYVASYDRSSVQVHQYIASTLRSPLGTLRIDTNYPWSGEVTVHVDDTTNPRWTLQLRIPPWAQHPIVRVNGDEPRGSTSVMNGYLALTREWRTGDVVSLSLDIAPRLTEPHPRVGSPRGCVAIERGPLVYCVEGSDNPKVMDACLDPDAELTQEWQPDVLGGVMTIAASGETRGLAEWSAATFRPRQSRLHSDVKTRLTAIPYYAWANRGPGPMRVWVPTG